MALLLAALMLWVGRSRIHLQVHFPKDILAGWWAGACWVFSPYASMFCQPARFERNMMLGSTA